MNKFLEILARILEEEHWGDIDPSWFSPALLDKMVEEEDDDQENAKALQDIVRRALEEAGLKDVT